MTQEEKELLLKDLSSRLPYGVKCQWGTYYEGTLIDVCKCKTEHGFVYWDCYFEECGDDVPIEIVKPYLRTISSITEEERVEIGKAIQKDRIEPYGEIKSSGSDNLLLCTIRQAHNLMVWLLKNHFDFNGLIERGLAINCTDLNIY